METQNKKLKPKINIYWFTLVELIIVITILAILATIWFMSFQSYTLDARDGKRKAELWEVRTALEIYKTKKWTLPMPDIKYVEVVSISYQWYVWDTVLWSLRWTSNFKDPLDDEFYTYITNTAKNKYQLMSLLENNNSLISYNLLNQANSAWTEYLNRFPYVLGDWIWALTDENKNPIQEVYSWTINLSSYSSWLIIYESNTDTTSWTGWAILEALDTEVSTWSGCIFWTSKIWSCTL